MKYGKCLFAVFCLISAGIALFMATSCSFTYVDDDKAQISDAYVESDNLSIIDVYYSGELQHYSCEIKVFDHENNTKSAYRIKKQFVSDYDDDHMVFCMNRKIEKSDYIILTCRKINHKLSTRVYVK